MEDLSSDSGAEERQRYFMQQSDSDSDEERIYDLHHQSPTRARVRKKIGPERSTSENFFQLKAASGRVATKREYASITTPLVPIRKSASQIASYHGSKSMVSSSSEEEDEEMLTLGDMGLAMHRFVAEGKEKEEKEKKKRRQEDRVHHQEEKHSKQQLEKEEREKKKKKKEEREKELELLKEGRRKLKEEKEKELAVVKEGKRKMKEEREKELELIKAEKRKKKSEDLLAKEQEDIQKGKKAVLWKRKAMAEVETKLKKAKEKKKQKKTSNPVQMMTAGEAARHLKVIQTDESKKHKVIHRIAHFPLPDIFSHLEEDTKKLKNLGKKRKERRKKKKTKTKEGEGEEEKGKEQEQAEKGTSKENGMEGQELDVMAADKGEEGRQQPLSNLRKSKKDAEDEEMFYRLGGGRGFGRLPAEEDEDDEEEEEEEEQEPSEEDFSDEVVLDLDDDDDDEEKIADRNFMLLCKLSRALHIYGAPANRTESALLRVR